MLFEKLKIKKIENNAYPMGLLLLADETIEAIERYLYDCTVYSVWNGLEEIAVFCLYRQDAKTVEIKNIAVSTAYQNKKIGSFLVQVIKNLAKEQQFETLIVGTADTGQAQIRFYERNGFVLYDTRKNFFLDNYPAPIFENGKQLVDMVLLKMEL
ncbi:GNAT family N-acetyltransferase [Myroides sp. DW712]|uniref:GNAT family N-acetyltransferase n=1 Tax=Myroides sp. DW712 TaxID=3389800 RepID=UPI00397AB42D